jgi:hypothetical protein
MTANYTQERSVMYRGRAVLAMNRVLAGAEQAVVAGRSVKR